MKAILRNCLILCTALLSLPSLASNTERANFIAARQALNAGQTARFEQLAPQLRNYPLSLYLRYDELNTRLGTASSSEVQSFLDAAADSPLAERLRRSRLKLLASQQRWSEFIALYAPELMDTELDCQYLRATQTSPATDAWLEHASLLWKVGHSQPNACDVVFATLSASTHMNSELIWERIRLAMAEGNLSLAAHLSKSMSDTDRAWVDLWRKLHEMPSTAPNQTALRTDSLHAREIIAHAAARWARSDAYAAHAWWLSVQDQYAFTTEQQAQTASAIALQAAYKRLPVAHQWLAAVPESVRTETLRAWQARSALLHQDWPALAATIADMPEAERLADEWRYWLAQTHRQLGKADLAQPLLQTLAAERSFHGFLAADQLDLKYSLNNRPVTASNAELIELQQRVPALLRAGELLHTQFILDARREWAFGTRNLDARDLERAALMAHQWGWHDRAIFTIAKAKHFDDMTLRFPTLHAQDVLRVAAPLQIDPSWVMGVMRQESAFIVDVRSSAGAHGLMQLMPGTAADMARLLKLPKPSTADLQQASTNIRLGSQYLRQTLDSLGNTVLATAGYNAGPGRVRRWLPEGESMPTPLWIDTIPFSETRGYVRNVMAYTTIYDARLERPLTALQTRMPATISPR